MGVFVIDSKVFCFSYGEFKKEKQMVLQSNSGQQSRSKNVVFHLLPTFRSVCVMKWENLRALMCKLYGVFHKNSEYGGSLQKPVSCLRTNIIGLG